MLERVPALVTECPQWLLWKPIWLPAKQKWTKVPYQANGYQASVTNPAHWCSFASARDVFAQQGEAAKLGGLGFVLGHKSRTSGVDLDRCIDQAGNIVDHTAIEIAKRFDTYTELSPSGTGLHALFIANVMDGKKVDRYEVYGTGRYFTVTGNVYIDKPLAERQETVDAFIQYLDANRKSKANLNVDWSIEPKFDNEELYRRCAVDNKFIDLWNDRWQDHYASRSEADLALADMIALHTDSVRQVQSMFAYSGLYMNATDDKYRKRPALFNGLCELAMDRKVPTVDLARRLVEAPAPAKPEKPKPVTEDDVARAADVFTLPPGAMGAVAQFVYQQAPYPMREAAIAAALTLFAGICGRQYQYEGTGLNLYTMLLANTGAGKESMSTGLGKIMDAVCNPSKDPNASKTDIGYPAARCFRGPAQLTGKGLHRVFEKCESLSFFSVGNEFADTMRQMSDPKSGNQGTSDLKRALLDMYSKASEGNTFAGQMTAEKDTSIGTLNSPAFTMLVESTPDKLYGYLTPDLIKEGLLSRMLVIQFDGFGEFNERHHQIEVDPALVGWLRSLCDNVFMLKRSMDKRIQVAATPEAQQLLKSYRVYARERLKGDDESTRDLWNRAALATNRIAALIAIGCDMNMPTIQVQHVEWAWRIVSRQVVLLSGKFKRGETGDQTLNTGAQIDEVMKACRKFYTLAPEHWAGQQNEKIYRDGRMAGYVPYGFILSRTSGRGPFKGLPHKRAVQEAIDGALSSGLLTVAKHPEHHLAKYYSLPIFKD